MHDRLSARIRQSRTRVGGIGFIIGLLVGLPVSWLGSLPYISLTTFMLALCCSAVVLMTWERKKGLPTVDDLQAAKFQDAENPLGLSQSDDGGLKPTRRT